MDTISHIKRKFLDMNISEYKELLAYEFLWSKENSSLKRISQSLNNGSLLASEKLKEEMFFNEADFCEIDNALKDRAKTFSVLFKNDEKFPKGLLNVKYPLGMLYYKGNLNLLKTICVSVVGSRHVSPKGKIRTEKLVKELDSNVTIVSGLAKGVDTAALTTAINLGKNVIGVIGTPIDHYYPKENKELQDEIATNHLLISQVPLYKYDKQSFVTKRLYFPERNVVMAAISNATIIVEASETSGTHSQAKACFDLGKKLFILNSCFENRDITWPAKYLEKGAVRVKTITDIKNLTD